MANASSDTFDNMRGQAAQLFQSIVEQATSRAMEATHTGSKKGQKAHRFSRAQKQTTPSVRDIALNAASGAIELWQAARDKAENTVDVVQHTVADSASELRSSATGMKDEAVEKARLVVADGAHRVGDAAHRVGDTAHRASDAGKSAAATSADAGKNTMAFLFWGAAAGAIVYYALLDEHRRDQAREIAMKAISEGRALLSDLQGEDGEFA
jgi:hypothetical protein